MGIFKLDFMARHRQKMPSDDVIKEKWWGGGEEFLRSLQVYVKETFPLLYVIIQACWDCNSQNP